MKICHICKQEIHDDTIPYHLDGVYCCSYRCYLRGQTFAEALELLKEDLNNVATIKPAPIPGKWNDSPKYQTKKLAWEMNKIAGVTDELKSKSGS